MTEFIFCPRAGLITFETKQEDDDNDDRELQGQQKAQLTYRPYYSLRPIEESLEKALNDLRRLPKLAGGTALVSFLLLLLTGALQAWLLALVIPALILIFGTFNAYPRISYFGKLRDMARKALPREPDPQSVDNTAINWWSLLAAGFDSVPYRDTLKDHSWRVAGKPWRVLRKGSLRIPVWRRRGEAENQAKIRGQHYARMAAYCRLIEKAEGGSSPYGIILFGNSYDGIAIANNQGSRSAFHKGLREARQVIKGKQRWERDPSPPSTGTICSSCPLGKPFTYRPGESDNRPGRLNTSPHLAFGDDGRAYHSECGDRFQWIPPHQKAFAKRLIKY
ncbi:hypothetical protein C7293_04840 [filamentous cyanobacterium CCT1]|nr:hypothetical protein C7293_04840 [filamentous cyanobacterium CCT1]PSN79013.1 hypothetical protein C8B47_13955 [filamentous cyanobacterium CCP4]